MSIVNESLELRRSFLSLSVLSFVVGSDLEAKSFLMLIFIVVPGDCIRCLQRQRGRHVSTLSRLLVFVKLDHHPTHPTHTNCTLFHNLISEGPDTTLRAQADSHLHKQHAQNFQTLQTRYQQRVT